MMRWLLSFSFNLLDESNPHIAFSFVDISTGGLYNDNSMVIFHYLVSVLKITSSINAVIYFNHVKLRLGSIFKR